MSRAAEQRVVYALKNGRLVPKSVVLAEVAGGHTPAAAAQEPAAPDAGFSASEPDQPIQQARRPGRPPKVRDDPESQSDEDASAFEIKD